MDVEGALPVAVRFLGLALAVWAIPASWEVAHQTAQAFAMGHGVSAWSLWIDYGGEREIPDRFGHVLVLVVGVYLFLDGRWVIRRCMRGTAGRCARCGYDLRGLTIERCPECGLRAQKP